VIVIGGGIAGLTAACLLAHEGVPVTLLEAHHQTGGCAGTFRRGAWTFDVGATQVAGLEPGGSHARLFRHLNLPLPEADILDPGCVVDLADGSPPIHLWHDPERWQMERQKHFPGSERFWAVCSTLHRSNWSFAARDPVVTPRSIWDLGQLMAALRPATLASGVFTGMTIADLLVLCGCGTDQRLRRFLDLQLKLYSQEPAERTAVLYGATVLQMAQAPLGLFHLQGSMQMLSRHLEEALMRDGGRLLLRHRVTGLQRQKGRWQVDVNTPKDRSIRLEAKDVICSLPPQCLPDLIPSNQWPTGYSRRLKDLPEPSGALVFYGAVRREALPDGCPGHLQWGSENPGSLFISVSRAGDGRAPEGEATVIASVFTPTADWCRLAEPAYQRRKQEALQSIRSELERLFQLQQNVWLHTELATPRGFAGWTGRPRGMVGGLGQHPSRFGPFGLAGRSPMRGLWLCGDSLYPGEGTAGVSLSALNACRQLMAERGKRLIIED
jgi:C-3',4' desaturase CrtD